MARRIEEQPDRCKNRSSLLAFENDNDGKDKMDVVIDTDVLSTVCKIDRLELLQRLIGNN